MLARLRKNKGDILAGAVVTLRAIRDSSEVFPPLKSVVAAVVTIWEMSRKVKSNKKDCMQLASRLTEIVHDLLRQTKDYGDQLPLEAQHSIAQIELILHDVGCFMKQLGHQGFFRRYARQDDNRDQIMKYEKSLDEALLMFGVSMQISMHRRLAALDNVSRERYDKVLDISRMSESEREFLTKILAKTERSGLNLDVPAPHLFFFSVAPLHVPS